MNSIDSALFLLKNTGFIVVGLIGINFLVTIHELGHFLFCKLFNIKTPTFSIGMGSFIVSKKIGDTTFGIARWPLGGYVEIGGLAEVGQGEQKEAALAGPQSFAEKPYWQKFLVLFGGIITNILFAYFAFSLIFMLGVPKSPIAYPENASTEVEVVTSQSPAQKAGLRKSDIITKIDETEISSAKEAIEYIHAHAGKEITLQVSRQGDSISLPITIESKEIMGKKSGLIGVAFAMHALPASSFLQSIKKGFTITNTHIINTFKAFAFMFFKRDMSLAGGPIAMIKASADGIQSGFKVFLMLLAIISINLAVLNTFPLPILDGGQLLFATIEAIIRRPLNEQIREYIHIASWIGILLLVAFLSARDIYRIIEPLIKKFIP